MESEVIVYSFLAAALISVIGFGIFIWINMKDRSIDERIYKSKTDPRNLVSKYKHIGQTEEDAVNPVHSLKKYSVGTKKVSPTMEIRDTDSKEEVETEESSQQTPEQTQESEQDDSRFAPPWLKKDA